MILSGLDLGGLRGQQIGTSLKSCEEVSKWQVRFHEDSYWIVLGALEHHQIRTAHKNGKNKKNKLKSVKMLKRIGTHGR
jgi:hypothetical protein